MRKIIVSEFITLDGVIESPGGNETPHPHGGWQFNYRSVWKAGNTRWMSLPAWIPCCWAKPLAYGRFLPLTGLLARQTRRVCRTH